MLCNILEIQRVLTSTVVDYAIKLCIVFLILYIKSSPNPTSKLLHFLHQMVLKLFFGCCHNISSPDPEGADQPEER